MKQHIKHLISRNNPFKRSKKRTQLAVEALSDTVHAHLATSLSVLHGTISYNRHGGYCVPLSSAYRPAAQSILRGDVWESETIDFMVEHVGTGDIVHAGTYFGDFLPALSRACSPGSVVWAFEPNPENFRCAKITMAINTLSNVNLKNAGVGEANSMLPMRIFGADGMALGGTSRFLGDVRDVSPEQTVQVETVRLDDHIPEDRRISLIQLDVEGFEQQALSGALRLIERCRPVIILENLPGDAWMQTRIFAMGYSITGKLHQNTVLTPNGERE